MDIKQILIDLGYSPFQNGIRELRMRPIYRNSDNNTSLKVDGETGQFVDFSVQIHGNLQDLIKLTLNLPSIEAANQWLKTKDFNPIIRKEKPSLRYIKTFSESKLKSLVPKHDYWLSRGISLETLELFQGGVVEEKNKMQYRYVFPIFNLKKEILGFSGRDLKSNEYRPKWKIVGTKSEFIYPIFLNEQEIIDKKEIILVESIGDMLALWEAGIKNVLVIFGTSLSVGLINCLLRYDPSRIYIALNNEPDNNEIGNQAAAKIAKVLLKYFDGHQIHIRLPYKKDFGEMDKEQIKEWYANCPL